MIDSSVLALASVIVAGIAALANPIATVLTTRARLAHERKQARAEREQRRLEATYEPLAEYLLLIRDFANRTEPMMSWTGDPGPPDLPPLDELRKRETKATMYGSSELQPLLEALSRQMNTFMARVRAVRAIRAGEPGADAEGWPKLTAARDEVRATVKQALAQIGAELRRN